MRYPLVFLLLWLGATGPGQAQLNPPGVAAPPPPAPLPYPTAEPGFQDSAVVQASHSYAAGKFHTWLLGRNYRREWQQPVRVAVLDLGRAHGGLTPVKQGGGMQTKSLRLRAADGQQYVLRSVDKTTDSALPADLRGTLAARVVQDQISAEHPYAALILPVLAEAAGVGHTAPRLVLVPDDARLGEFRSVFGGMLAYLETREPRPPATFTGQPQPRALDTEKVLELLQQSPLNRVDERQVLRARLFDMVLADWDRHDDQWRWWAYPQPDGGLLLRPVPRDRDQAFFVNQGVVPRVASRRWALPKIQGFDGELRDVNTFSFNARYFDRTFLTGLEEAFWRQEAAALQADLSDDVIARAMQQLPASIYKLSAPELTRRLRQNRDALPRYAARYYRFLARQVNVVGSDANERFEVTHLNRGSTRVRVTTLGTNGAAAVPHYERTFRTAETRELDIYARGGADQVVISGPGPARQHLRVIGGAGNDLVYDSSNTGRGSARVLVYDTPEGNTLRVGPSTRLRTSRDSAVNRYDRRAYRYPYTGPLLPWAFNIDDGLFVGLGLAVRRPGFRKEPWAVEHRLTANVALATGAFNFGYAGQFTHVVGRTDLLLHGDLQAPNYVRNFFGLGNESDYDQDRGIGHFRVRFRNFSVEALARRRLGLRHELRAGPVYQTVRVERTAGRFIEQWQDERGASAGLFQNQQYGGVKLGYVYDGRNSPLAPTKGLSWRTEYQLRRRLDARARLLSQLTSQLSGFLTPWPRLTLASRVGSTLNFGHYEFFQAATLGGVDNLRGYRRTRFAGDHSLYNNTEARLQLLRLSTQFLKADFGLLAFHDLGRVWFEGEQSKEWHTGYGGGVWVKPLDRLVLTAVYGFSDEDRLPLIRLGFFF